MKMLSTELERTKVEMKKMEVEMVELEEKKAKYEVNVSGNHSLQSLVCGICSRPS